MAKRSGIMLAYPFEEGRLEKWKGPVFVQPKLDGERCRNLVSSDPILLSSEQERKNFAVPDLISQSRELFFNLGEPLELDGELYIHGEDFEDIHSIVSRTVNRSPLHHQMEFHVFDIIDLTVPQIERTKRLIEISKSFPPSIKLVPTTVAENAEEVRRIFNRYISEGYEGIVVRNIDAPYIRRRSTYMMKFKPKKSDIYDVVGYVEGTGKYAGTIGALQCQGDDGTIFEVGSFSITDEERKKLWNMREELASFSCKVGYQHLTSKSGVPKSGVFIELIEKFNHVKDVNLLL